MRYCDLCKVSCEDSKTHCPLCGHCIDENCDKKNANEIFPDYEKYKFSRTHIAINLIKLAFLLMIFAVAIDLIIFASLSWSMYVIVALFAVILGVLLPIRYKYNLATQTSLNIIGFTTVIVICETFTKTFGWGVGYVIPFFLLAMVIFSGVMTIVKGYVEFDYLRPLVFIVFCSILLVIFNSAVFGVVTWPSSIALLASVGVIIALLIFRTKRTIRGLKKHFRI